MNKWLRHIVVFILIWVSSLGSLFAQANPFEMQGNHADQPTVVDSAQALSPKNPFEINREGAIKRNEHEVVFNNPELLKDGWKMGGGTFWVIIFLLFMLAIIMSFGRATISAFYRALTGGGPFNILYRNYGSILFPVGVGLYIFYFLNMGLLVFLVAKNFGWLPKGETRGLFLIIGIITLLVLTKQIIVRFLGWVFPISKDTAKYGFLIGVFNSTLGLIIFPINWLLAYGPEPIRQPLIYATGALVITFYLYRYLIGTASASQQIIRNKFNFFMYLCTLEIAPALVLIRFILSQKG